MDFPEDLLFTKTHEWARVEDDIMTVGITDFAQKQLGDITYIELPEEGQEIAKDDVYGTVDSLKTVSELYAPVSGVIIEVNDSLPNSAELINEDPYGEAWMIKIEMSNTSELEDLLDAKSYAKFCAKQKEKTS